MWPGNGPLRIWRPEGFEPPDPRSRKAVVATLRVRRPAREDVSSETQNGSVTPYSDLLRYWQDAAALLRLWIRDLLPAVFADARERV